MRKLLLSCFLLTASFAAHAQPAIVTATFDTMHLSQTDTFYVNYSAPGTDVGFDDGALHFPCVYDTAFGFSFWSYGFVYSNMTDSSTSGLINQYAAKPGSGVNNTATYAVAYGGSNVLKLTSDAVANGAVWSGMYITNGTYPYNSMRDGDAFAKKFGGASGADPDWFKLVVKKYLGSQLTGDSVEFYLADFRGSNDYIVNGWQWLDLSSFGYADSLLFTLTSSDTGQFGMNTPAYFCIDNVTLIYPSSVPDQAKPGIKIYPVPAMATLHVNKGQATYNLAAVLDMAGRIISTYPLQGEITSIPTAQLPHGTYLLRLSNGTSQVSVRFIKQ